MATLENGKKPAVVEWAKSMNHTPGHTMVFIHGVAPGCSHK